MPNFDQILDNQTINNIRWNTYKDRDVIAMTVADMDFTSPQPILDALNDVTNHGIFGYTKPSDELNSLVIKRLAERHHWQVEEVWIIWTPGLVPAITGTCKAIGGTVLTCTPVYHPFLLAPNWVDVPLKTVPFIEELGRMTFDFKAIENAMTLDVKLFLLCNPHNPGGMVFRKEELEKLVEICIKHDIIICSDEIHCDLILDASAKHISVASLSEEAQNQVITLLAPSKTFNIAGLGCAFVVIPNPELKAKFNKATAGFFPQLSRHAYSAATAAYRDCDDWRLALVQYLKTNHDYLQAEINSIKGLKMNTLEATYLAWIDFRESGIENLKALWEEGGVGVADGKVYGKEGFVRMNFGCPKAQLEEAVRRIKRCDNVLI